MSAAITIMIRVLFIWITGKDAALYAMAVIKLAGIPAKPINHGAIGGISAAINPRIVTGATSGAAKTFAKIEVIDRYPLNATIIGEQRIVAAIGSATTFGALIFGAINNKPAVAKTDSANPGSLDCQGSARTTIAIAK